ncbi:hypothetical protein CHLNCDRAFT_136751 [Chlorella variabilis]|uniref:Fungal lipase-type domain-containing protein n=1 Tax=Chlorella variabilis TaxID=554065 RepID=E1ZL01_CHLVA|nr:hypothetical protein CHLNCDRAFT_136751 [Chlorella variabilis]EFN53573.1 hypothetical protein CHLNCDRAFT_136751 [Chlorella variabilis]|eukprot:XP_005845675.1 hypothetical protein CHLNCDRAFT_136751 [Chlorella variabilis]
MSVSAVAAAGTALALYYYGRRGGVCSGSGEPVETHVGLVQAPTSFMDDLFFLAEGLRWVVVSHRVDRGGSCTCREELLSPCREEQRRAGLACLGRHPAAATAQAAGAPAPAACRLPSVPQAGSCVAPLQDPEEHPVADIAQLGRPFGRGLAPQQWPEALAQLRELDRFFRYCSGLRERRPLPQRQYFRTVLDVTDEDLLMQELRAGVLKPSFVLVRDRQLKAVVLAIRGTHSFKDMFTSLTGASKPHHLVDANGVVLGYSHFGMLAAARWIKGQTRQRMEQALAENPGYRLSIIGHSLGGGTAALLTMMLREAGGPFAGVTCIAVACPSCMTLELAQSCSDYVTTVVHNADVIPTICPGSADALREEVMRRWVRAVAVLLYFWYRCSWFGEFRRDVRSSGIVRAVECGIRGVGSATLTATSWTTSKLAACYQRGSFAGASRRRQPLKRRNSDDSLAATAAAEQPAAASAPALAGGGCDAEASSSALPVSTSVPASSSQNLLTAAGEDGEAAGRSGGSQGQWAAAWSQRVSQQLSGRSAAVLSSTSQVLRNTSGVLRSTSGLLLRRMWPGGEAEPAAGGQAAAPDGGGRDSSPSNTPAGIGSGGPFAGAAADVAPGPMEIDEEEDSYEEVEAEAEEAFLLEAEAAAEAAGGGPQGRMSYQERRQMRVQLQMDRSGSLEEEVSLRMHEVQQAVQDAEEEEEAMGRDDSTVPAVIRPGGYGIGGASSSPRISPSKRDPQWKRHMYPAGRILHLVPARLVPGTAAHAAAEAAAAREAKLAAAAAEAAEHEQRACAAAAAAAGGAGGDGQGPAAAAGAAGGGGVAPDGGAASGPAAPKHASKLSVSDLIAGDGLLGQRSGAIWPDDGSSGGGQQEGAAPPPAGPQQPGQQQQQQQQQQQPQEEMLLLDCVPQEGYARIKLCRTVLSDHIIPNYLRSLESALEHIQEHALVVAPAPGGRAGAGDAAAAAAAAAAQAEDGAAAAAAAPPQQPPSLAHPAVPGGSPVAAAAAAALRGAAARSSFARGGKLD